MSVDNSRKKTFVFSSESGRKLIETTINDRAKENQTTQSAVINEALVHYLAPENPIARSLVEKLYSGTSLNQCYIDTFKYLADHADYDASKKFIRLFSQNIARGMQRFTGKEPQFPHLLELLAPISEIAQSKDYFFRNFNLRKELEEWPEYTTILDCVAVILRNWDVLQSDKNTYDALVELAHIAVPTFVDTPETRSVYVDALKQWNPQQEKIVTS